MTEKNSREPDAPPVNDPPVWFDDPELAYDALVAWAEESAHLEDRRDPLVRGALRVFEDHGDVARVHRATKLSRSTIERIEKSASQVPAAAEHHWPDLLLYAGVLRAQAERARERARLEKDPKTANLLRVEGVVLDSLAERVKAADYLDDAQLQALAARLRRSAAAARRPFTDTYEGRHPRDPQFRALDEMEAGHYTAVAEQITQFRLRGDAAFDDLDPALVEESRQRCESELVKDNSELYGGERHFVALRQGRTVHGSPAADAAAGRLLRIAKRKRELESELAQLSSAARLVEDIEEACQGRGTPAGLCEAAASDETVHQALIDVLGEDSARDFLANHAGHADHTERS
ncbi:hypothetical protein ACH4VR_40375 [Streptomyces sp. NPDC020883]|uniref:hypothetical protein n=1 Tax=Streptomyces sp. NPDC020883 TaxID=3365099 RepID=UPI0037955A4D